MKYVGSKSRIAPAIVPIIQEHIQKSGARAYVEPFVGGANVIDKIAAEYRIGFDINGYLIALLQYVKSGGLLPDTISREQYAAIRSGMHYFPAWKVGGKVLRRVRREGQNKAGRAGLLRRSPPESSESGAGVPEYRLRPL